MSSNIMSAALKKHKQPKKVRKPARKRDASRLFPETPIGRLVNFSAAGKEHFERVPIQFNDALHYLAAHPKTKKKALNRKFKLTSRQTNTILRKFQGMRESAISNQENQIGDTEAHIAKAEVKLAKRIKAKSKHIGSLKDKIQRLNDKLEKQRRELNDPGIFFGRAAFQNQPIQSDFTSTEAFELARARFLKNYGVARYGLFGCVGSHDEEYGNRTYQVRADEAKQEGDYYYVPIWHSREMLAKLRLSEKDYHRLVAYQKTKEAITVYFHRDRNHWMGHITLMMEGPKVYTPSNATVSLDTNGKSLDWLVFRLFEEVAVQKRGIIDFSQAKTTDQKVVLLRKWLTILITMAFELKAQFSMEDLDLRAKKKLDNGKAMNRVLHGIPYAEVMRMAARICCQMGVPIRFVNPAWTTAVGGVISAELTKLSRDHGAAVVIGLLASDAGMTWLNAKCKDLLAHGGKYRTTKKGAQNLTVTLRPNGIKPVAKRKILVKGGRRQSTAFSRPDLEDFYATGKALIRLQEKLYAAATKQSRRKRLDCDCPWEATAKLKSNNLGPVMHELAAGSLNVQNPANVWASL
jgi:IS605 OrfB family transposase